MRLVYKDTGVEVQVGDIVGPASHRMYVRSFPKPHSPSSSGTIYVNKYGEGNDLNSQGFYVSVYGMEWIEREDRHEDCEGRELTPVERQELEVRLAPPRRAPSNILATWSREFGTAREPKPRWLVLIQGEDRGLWEATPVPVDGHTFEEEPDYYPQTGYRWEKYAEHESHKDVAGAWSPHWW